MADFIGSIFGDATDEFQLHENINIQDKESSLSSAQAQCDKHDFEDPGTFEPPLEEEPEDAFSPVPVASMNSFDPTSMVSVHLTPKNQVVTVKVDGDEDAEASEKKRPTSMGAASQLGRALERLRALTIDENSSVNEKKKRHKTGE